MCVCVCEIKVNINTSLMTSFLFYSDLIKMPSNFINWCQNLITILQDLIIALGQQCYVTIISN